MSQTSLPALSILKNKRILLGVTGGIAAYKSAELVRLLTAQEAEVQVVMTDAAREFITPLTFQALTGRPVFCSQWPENDANRGMPHIDLSRWADCLLVAPCTANSMAKYALGLADNLLDNLVLARNCPLALAPAMNVEMWNNPATQRNVEQLNRDGIHLFGPASGLQACGEVGAGRMLEPAEVVWELARMLSPRLLAGHTLLITSGPTAEPIDPVRMITNRSSGKMGQAMAQAAWLMGAEVKLISGPCAHSHAYGCDTQTVESAKGMHAAVIQSLQSEPATIFVGVAAVADFAVKNPANQKTKKTPNGPIGFNLEFELNPDILATVGEMSEVSGKPKTVIGFAAETHDLDNYAHKKLSSKKAHFIVGNLAQHAMNSDHTEVTLYGRNLGEPIRFTPSDKLTACLSILSAVSKHL